MIGLTTMTTTTTETDESRESQHAEHRAKHWARRLALQALYQWDVSGEDAEGLLEQFLGIQDAERADAEYFKQLVCGVLAHKDELQEPLLPVLDRSLERIDPVERAVLRIACYEFRHCPNVPLAVVLAEATQLAGQFGTEKGSKYVNAVLDKVAGTLRGPHAA